MFRIRFTPSANNSWTCSSAVSSGPRNKKFGRIVETVKTGKASSVLGGSISSCLAVIGEGGRGVVGVLGVPGREWAGVTDKWPFEGVVERSTLRYCDTGIVDVEPDIDVGKLGLRYEAEGGGGGIFNGLGREEFQGFAGPVRWVADFENCVLRDSFGCRSINWVSILRRLGTLGRLVI